jgi:hypothetical protein
MTRALAETAVHLLDLAVTSLAEAGKCNSIHTCGALPCTEALMNCTAWPKMRNGEGPPRYCDFNGSSDK